MINGHGGVKIPWLAALLTLAGRVAAQQGLPYDWTEHYSPDSTLGGEFGLNMTVLDMNHDGFGDLVATDALKAVDGLGGAGKAFILYGPQLAAYVEIHASQPSIAENLGKTALSIGDVNGDGEYDILLGSFGYDAGGGINNNVGRAHLFLGSDFVTDVVFDSPAPESGGGFGIGVALGDIDGDGLDDVVVGGNGQSRVWGSTVLSFAGRTWFWPASSLQGPPVEVVQPKPATSGQFGYYVTTVPSGGRRRDVLVSAANYWAPSGQSSKGVLYRYDGLTAGLLALIEPPAGGYFMYAKFGSQLDWNGDGHSDLVAEYLDGLYNGAILAGPSYTAPLVTFTDPDGGNPGYAFAMDVSDLDRDGHLDVLIGDPTFAPPNGAVHVKWGPGLHEEDDFGPGWFPYASAGLGGEVATGDIDGDGYPEVFTQMPAGFNGGLVHKFRRRTLQASATSLSIAAGESVTFTLDLPADQSGRGYLAALSLTEPGTGMILGAGSYLPLSPDGMTTTGLSLLGSSVLEGFVGTLDAQGHAVLTLHWPAGKGANLAGSMLHVAAIAANAAGQPGAGSNEVVIALVP